MNWKIKDFMADTKEPLRRGYWKMTAVSFLLLLLSGGLSYTTLMNSVTELPQVISDVISNEFSPGRNLDARMFAVLLTLAGGILIFGLLLKIILDVFLINPLEVGTAKMFLSSMESGKRVMISDLAYGYDTDYINTVKIQLVRKLLQYLWMFLLIIPGIYKTYQYMMIPYLLVEDPYLPVKEAFAKSKAMMKGNIRMAFLLDVYFFLWTIVGFFTLGIVDIFYVEPKRRVVEAHFYLKIKEKYEGEQR